MLAPTFASTHQTENPRGFSEVDENKQLLIAIVVLSLFLFSFLVHYLRNYGSVSKMILSIIVSNSLRLFPADFTLYK